MPITVLSDEEIEEIASKDGATGLRKHLSDANKVNRELTQRLVRSEAQAVIAREGLTLVSPEDFSGVGLDEVEAKARELQQAKLDARANVLREVYIEKGLEGDELEQAVADMLGSGQATSTSSDSPEERMRRTDMIVGRTRPADDGADLFGVENIAAGLRESRKS